jgi:hypothetical protein
MRGLALSATKSSHPPLPKRKRQTKTRLPTMTFLNFPRLVLFVLSRPFLGRICFVGLRNVRRPSLIDLQGWVASQTICSVMANHAN